MAVQWNLDLLSFLGVFFFMYLLGHCPAGGPMTFNRDAALWHCFVALRKHAEKSPDFLVSRSDSRQQSEPETSMNFLYDRLMVVLYSNVSFMSFTKEFWLVCCVWATSTWASCVSLSAVGFLDERPHPRTLQHRGPSTSTSLMVDAGNIRVSGDGLVALRLSVLVYDLLSDICRLFSASFSFSACALCYAQ